ncbi:MAG: hypothetical protein ICV64_05935 [Thermoleophilia bacterium]|nr:hypothetical protein [Thermoleophilia bacterium]
MTRAALTAAAAVLSAATLSAPALAAYRPQLLVVPQGRGSAEGTRLVFTQPAAHDATARVVIAVPAAYTVTLGQPPGTVLGDVQAEVTVQGFDAGAIPVAGRAVVADPTAHAISASACGVTGPPAVWRLELAAQTGQALAVTLFVERVGSFVALVGCLPPPDVPPELGGAPFGVKLVSASVTVGGVFAAPRRRGRHVWRGLFTPYRSGTAVPEAQVEARAVVPVPASLVLAARVERRPSPRAALSGRLREAGAGVAGVRVELWEALGPQGQRARRVAHAATRRGGRFSFRRPASRTRWYSVRALARDATARECRGPTAPGGCVSATVAPAASGWVCVRAPARR